MRVALLLARIAVSERGWHVESDDLAAIAEVARVRVESHGGDLEDALRALSPRLARCEVTRAWICELDEDGHRPRHWPRSASWARRRPQWLATLAEAVALVETPRSVCSEPPVSWGSDRDVARGRSHGHRWHEVDCGETRNHFGRWL